MGDLPTQGNVVVIGAGIVGNSIAYHLALHGWKDIVLLDKGPLPNPGGSTGHASNFIFLVDHSKEMTDFTLDSVRQYRELGVFTQSGGDRGGPDAGADRGAQAADDLGEVVGGGAVELLTAAEVRKLVPFIDDRVILGGFSTPGVGVVDSLRAGHAHARAGAGDGRAHDLGQQRGDRHRRGPRSDPRGSDPPSGDIRTEVVVVCCGVWSPRIAKMAGASIPLTPAVHQMIDVGPVPMFAESVGEIEFAIVRDVDTNMYERQHGGDLEVGSYAHRPILWNPDDIPSIEASAMTPTELPFTKEDFDPQMEHALELMPEILGRRAGRREVRDQRAAVAHPGRQPDPG